MFRHLLYSIVSRVRKNFILNQKTSLSLWLILGVISYLGGMTGVQAEPATEADPSQSPLISEPSGPQEQRFQDGIYLYGQSPEADQLGQAYMVFEAQRGQLVGAFYLPRSSFDCFSGVVEGNQLALNIVDSYTQKSHNYAVRYFQPATYATASTAGGTRDMTLEGFHRILVVSENDHRMLETCKADFQ